jgi:hypothetical protein
MGAEFNSINAEWPVTISPDGKYFFFARYTIADQILRIYWVDSRVIRQFKSKN